MLYYVHINTIIDSYTPYSKNELKSFKDMDEIYLHIREILFDTEYEDPIDYYDLPPYELFEEVNVEISIFDSNMNNIFNLGKMHQNKWSDFENFCFRKNEGVKIKTYKLFTESKKDKFPNIKKMEIDGFIVYIGKDAKSNDHLTFNIADKEDIWMHVKGVPGSHVVIRVRDRLPTNEVIKQAAQIAKKNSKSSKEDSVKVVYCQRRFVKKEIGMNDGQVKVDYINAQEIKI